MSNEIGELVLKGDLLRNLQDLNRWDQAFGRFFGSLNIRFVEVAGKVQPDEVSLFTVDVFSRPQAGTADVYVNTGTVFVPDAKVEESVIDNVVDEFISDVFDNIFDVVEDVEGIF